MSGFKMSNVCEPKLVSASAGITYPNMCERGMRAFQNDISGIITARQNLGLAHTKAKLDSLVREVQDKYRQISEACNPGNNIGSCGYVYGYDRFVKAFGPLATFGTAHHKPDPVPMRAMKSGYVVLPLASHPDQESMLDTGAQASGIAVEWRQRHPEYFHSAGEHIHKTVEQVMTSELVFTLGNLSFSPAMAVVTPALDMLEGSDNQHTMIAILGLDLLYPIPWEINYDNSIFTFHVDVEERLKDAKEKWLPIPVRLINNMMGYYMSVQAHVNNVEMDMLVDVGNNKTGIFEHCANKIPDLSVERTGTSVNVGGLGDSWHVQNVAVRVGGVAQIFSDLSVAPASDPQTPILASLGFCGLLGLDFLGRFNLLWDPENFFLYASPSKERAKIKDGGSIAFTPMRDKQSGRMIVAAVNEGEAADKAGLQMGDILTHVDGRSTREITILQMLDLRYSVNPATELTILRDGKEKKIILKR